MSNYKCYVLSVEILLYFARINHSGKISYDKLRPQGGRTTPNFSIGSRILIGIGSRIGIVIVTEIEIVMLIGIGVGI